MDVVYIVRHDPRNDPLRYSLRSVATHVPHRTIWVAGYLPPWVTDVAHVDVPQTATKYRNSTRNLRVACAHPGISDRFLLMNDDFFVMAPVAGEVPMAHRGPLAEVVDRYRRRYGPTRQYTRGMIATAELVARLGCEDPMSYELHMPMVIDKQRMAETIDYGAAIPVLHKRTLYGNRWQVGGTETVDVKVRGDRDPWGPDWPYLSTDKGVFHHGRVGHHIRAVFPERSIYETTPAAMAV